jgi:predicted nucleic acid-binding Zn ribbon protein
MENPTIQKIFQLGWPEYEKTHLLPQHIRDAVWHVINCRTSALGGHVQSCPDGHFHRIWYNSCKHRSCPQCAFIQVEEWMRKQEARLLDCAHFHVVFTLPDKLSELWASNQKVMTQILFSASKETLMEMLADEKHLGAAIGIISTLHTWTKTQLLHPHVHCIVTGGWLTENGEWKEPKNGILLPGRAVRAVYRGKTRDFLLKALKKGDLVLPEGMSGQRFKNLLNKLGRKKWNVRVGEKYSHGSGVANYLARYVRGGSIGNKRIKKIENGNVTFDAGRGEELLVTVSVEEFIRRWIQHVPEPRSVRARSYGLYAHGKKAELDKCRKLLGQEPVRPVEKIDWRDLFEKWDENSGRCPVCGKRLIQTEVFGSKEAPTTIALEAKPPDRYFLETAA